MKWVIFSLLILLANIIWTPDTGAQDLQYNTSALWASAKGVEVVDKYAFCAYPNGLVILDVSDPQNPILVSRTFCRGTGSDVDVWGNYAFLTDTWAGLQIINISDPYYPVIEARYETTGRALAVTLSDGYAYVSEQRDFYNGYLLILDVSTPNNPQYTGQFNTTGSSGQCTIIGNYAYIVGATYEIEIVDISNPTYPTLANFFELGCASERVFVSGDTAYLISHCGGGKHPADEWAKLFILDVKNPAEPFIIGEYEFEDYTFGPVVVSGDYAYLNGSESANSAMQQILVMDVSDPAQPAAVGEFKTSGFLRDLTIIDNLIYAAQGSGGLGILDICVPSVPVMVGRWCEADMPTHLAITDAIAYVADGKSGLQIIDLSNPLQPTRIGRLSIPGSQKQIEVYGDLAFSIDVNNALHIIDLTDPIDPEVVSHIEGQIRAMSIVDDYAYLVMAAQGLAIYDISDPYHPTLVQTCSVPGQSVEIHVEGDFAYICSTDEGLQIVDISNPTAPEVRGSYTHENERFIQLAVADSYAYIPTVESIPMVGNGELFVLDVSDPDYPTYVMTLPIDCRPDVAYVAGDDLYVCTYDGRYISQVTVLDITNRSTPVVLTSYAVPGRCKDVVVAGSYVFVMNGASIMVLSYSTSVVEAPLAINNDTRFGLTVSTPVTGRADIRFNAPPAGDLRIDVIDISGRHCVSLLDGVVQTGIHQLDWDWRSAGLTSGTYFIRIKSGGQSVTRPITLIR